MGCTAGGVLRLETQGSVFPFSQGPPPDLCMMSADSWWWGRWRGRHSRNPSKGPVIWKLKIGQVYIALYFYLLALFKLEESFKNTHLA